MSGKSQLSEGHHHNGVTVQFAPAGHVLGSAQIRVEWKGLRITVSGDYKRLADPTCAAYQPLACDIFITEATFGLPVFRHPAPMHEMDKLFASLKANPDRTHMIGAYALGKAQRVIRLIRDAGYDEPIYIHGSLQRLCDYYERKALNSVCCCPPHRRRQKSRLCRQDRHCPAFGLCRTLGATLC